MKLPDEEELILHYYGESDRREEIDVLIAESDELAKQFESLKDFLDTVVEEPAPARSDLYGHEVWRRIRPELERSLPREGSRWLSLPKAAGWAIAASLLVVVSFWAGRETAPETDLTALSAEARNRILLVSVADHLERSQFLLVELVNAREGDLGGQPLATASELTTQNRLYRQAARNGGETEVEYVLEELERFLTELGHLPTGSSEELSNLVTRLERRNLIFKVRVLGDRLDERTQVTQHTTTNTPTTPTT
jgi:hypothetical protein